MFIQAKKVIAACKMAKIRLELTTDGNVRVIPEATEKIKRTAAIQGLLDRIKEHKQEIVLYLKLGLDRVIEDGDRLLTSDLTWLDRSRNGGVISTALELLGGDIVGKE